VDPCEGLTDDDIRTAIQNATGPKSALFVPEAGLVTLLGKRNSDIFLVEPTFLSYQVCNFFGQLKKFFIYYLHVIRSHLKFLWEGRYLVYWIQVFSALGSHMTS